MGAVSADVVAVEARRHAADLDATTVPGGSGQDHHRAAQRTIVEHRVLSLTQRRLTDPAAVIAGLPVDHQPPPRVDAYDELLRKRDGADTGITTPNQETG